MLSACASVAREMQIVTNREAETRVLIGLLLVFRPEYSTNIPVGCCANTEARAVTHCFRVNAWRICLQTYKRVLVPPLQNPSATVSGFPTVAFSRQSTALTFNISVPDADRQAGSRVEGRVRESALAELGEREDGRFVHRRGDLWALLKRGISA